MPTDTAGLDSQQIDDFDFDDNKLFEINQQFDFTTSNPGQLIPNTLGTPSHILKHCASMQIKDSNFSSDNSSTDNKLQKVKSDNDLDLLNYAKDAEQTFQQVDEIIQRYAHNRRSSSLDQQQ